MRSVRSARGKARGARPTRIAHRASLPRALRRSYSCGHLGRVHGRQPNSVAGDSRAGVPRAADERIARRTVPRRLAEVGAGEDRARGLATRALPSLVTLAWCDRRESHRARSRGMVVRAPPAIVPRPRLLTRPPEQRDGCSGSPGRSSSDRIGSSTRPAGRTWPIRRPPGPDRPLRPRGS